MSVPPTTRRLSQWALTCRSVRPTVLLTILIASIVAAAAPSANAQVVVFAPHPDDEALITSGIINRAKQAGQTIKVVVTTNGDCEGGNGTARQLETVSAMSRLGLPEDDIIFLGYPDCGLWRLYYSYTSPTSRFTSSAGRTQTYASSGLGRTDYHSYIYGTPGLYNGPTMLQDLTNVLRNYRPQDVYTTSAYDAHFDHWVLNLMVGDALVSLMRTDPTFQPTLHDGIVHEPCEGSCNPSYHWPTSAFDPTKDFPPPPFLSMTPLAWSDVESVVVP